MVGTEMVSAWLANVVAVLTALTLLAGLVAMADRVVGGRLKGQLRKYLGLDTLEATADEIREKTQMNDDKLDQLHREHGLTMVADHDLATALNSLGEVVCEEHDVPDDERPPKLDVDRMAERAEEAAVAWPGEFLRGGSGRVEGD